MAVCRTRHTGSLRVPGQRQTSQGESDPKPRSPSRGRRRWRAGRRFLHPCIESEGGTRQEAPAARMDRGGCCGGGSDPGKSGSSAAMQIAPVTGGTDEVPERGVVSRSPRKASSARSGDRRTVCMVRTAHRHRWAGVSTPRWTSDPPLRNSAN